MDDLTQRYYEAEMRYLREAVKSLHKRILIAPLCSISISPARDPYVERLFEGFAFLMGRLRENWMTIYLN